MQKHINFPLVEDVRPAMYTAMKYWGKKPHNIWREFIETYCPPNGLVLDPFAGSAITAFEAVKVGRKAIVFDLNPLTSFMIEVLTSKVDTFGFMQILNDITRDIENDKVYREYYNKVYNGKECCVYNYRWLDGNVVTLAVEIVKDNGKRERFLIPSDNEDKRKAVQMNGLAIPYWYPKDSFPNSPAITHKFIKDIGGNSFQFLWTRRNLYVLSKLFHHICRVSNDQTKTQLLSAFIQTLHLVSKMVVPRNIKSERDFSGSWGRADYMIRRRSMEQNPLVIFKRSCLGKQGILRALKDANASLPLKLRIASVNNNNKIRKTASINYGTLDVADISKYISPRSIDFIITDPPYAGLVPYLDLSLVWLVWLAKVNKAYLPDLSSEITIKKGFLERNEYRRRLNNAFKQLYSVLKDNGFIVITFHHKKIKEWNDFVHAVRLAGFRFDKVTHQYNRRSGESNVANPYGTSGADFYIRCVKHRNIDFTDDKSGLAHFITQKAIEIIASRNEPTPYTFLVSGLIPEMLQAGYLQPKEYQDEILRILSTKEGPQKIFLRTKNAQTKAGDYWWFNNPSVYINYPDLPLKERVEQAVISILRRKVAVKFDDVLGELFRSYPNGLTPDPRSIKSILEKYAYRSAGRWKIKPATIRTATEHTTYISWIAETGLKAGYRIFIGLREQQEITSQGLPLNTYMSVQNIDILKGVYDKLRLSRIKMIDVLWLSANNNAGISCIFEVENSTGFISAIQRASNVSASIPKFMVIPNSREKELLGIKDPLFVDAFKSNNWRYVNFAAISRLHHFAKPKLSELIRIAKVL